MLQDDIIVEYDTRSMSPIGLVCMDMPDDCTARLVDAAGQEVDALNTGEVPLICLASAASAAFCCCKMCLVCMDMPDDCSARLVDSAGQEFDALNTGEVLPTRLASAASSAFCICCFVLLQVLFGVHGHARWLHMPDDCTARPVDAAGQEVDAVNTGGLICA